ncbi:hypothetical protein PILCRDRAFT_813890 [Piloderma croceum F 1598]|uniref:Uncharacterized protein n=1 Tax=Piloderma croceum (strain F 1598) TaxID=765440 RepID=A0A0C3FXA2_PILCF|nr:hypothetical protein PILCRDRAFT_813890 [Piloderma croceum F 1598]
MRATQVPPPHHSMVAAREDQTFLVCFKYAPHYSDLKAKNNTQTRKTGKGIIKLIYT